MNRVFLQKYNAICGLGANINEITENIILNHSGIKPVKFQFEEEKSFPVAKFRQEDIKGFTDETTFFHDLCFHYLELLASETNLDFSDSNTLIIIATTKGNIDALNHVQSEASLHELCTSFQDKFKTVNKPIIISSACISGVMALTHAHDLVKTGLYKQVAICAVDLISNFVVSGFNSFQAISPEICAPYDENRSGVNLGEACAVAFVSNEASDIEIMGGASSNDANHISGPSRDGSGLSLAIQKAMKQSKVSNFDLINAHGTATKFNDEMECQAFNALGFENVPLNSLKAYFGHTLGAAGMIETILCAEMMKRNIAFKSLGMKTIGLTKPLNVLDANKNFKINTVLKTASGFGGCNAAVILKKYE